MESIKLDAVEFTSSPTKTQVENSLRDYRLFLNRAVGSMQGDGHHTADEPFVGATLNLVVQMKQVIDVYQGQSNLATPGPQPVRR